MYAVPGSHVLVVTSADGIWIYDWERRVTVSGVYGQGSGPPGVEVMRKFSGVLSGNRIVFEGSSHRYERSRFICIADLDPGSEVLVRYDLPPFTHVSNLAVCEGGEAFVAVVSDVWMPTNRPRHRFAIWRGGILDQLFEWVGDFYLTRNPLQAVGQNHIILDLSGPGNPDLCLHILQ